jgi:hypothetical protein
MPIDEGLVDRSKVLTLDDISRFSFEQGTPYAQTTVSSGSGTIADLDFNPYGEFKDYISDNEVLEDINKEDLEQRRADRFNPIVQLGEGNIGKALSAYGNLLVKFNTRMTLGTLLKVTEGAVAVASVLPAIYEGVSNAEGDTNLDATLDGINKGLAFMANNQVQRFLTGIDEGIKDALPFYRNKLPEDMSLLEQMTTPGVAGKFWADLPNFLAEDLGEGIQYATAAMIPGIAIAKAGKGIRTIAGLGGLSAYQTIGEATVEGKGVFNESAQKLSVENYGKNYEFLNPEEKAIVDAEAGDKAAQTMKANAALLFVNNLLENYLVFTPFSTSPQKLNTMFATGEAYTKAGEKALKHLYSKPIQIGKTFLVNSFREGIVEEGLQVGISTYYTNNDINKTNLLQDITGILEEYTKGFGTLEGQKSMLLGMMIGGAMGIPTGLNTAKTNKLLIEGTNDMPSAKARYETAKKNSLKDLERVDGIMNQMTTVAADTNLKPEDKDIKLKSLRDELVKIEISNSMQHDETPYGNVTGENTAALIDRYTKIKNLDNEKDFSETIKPQLDEAKAITNEARAISNEYSTKGKAVPKDIQEELITATTTEKKLQPQYKTLLII